MKTQTKILKQSAALDKALLKKSSLNIPLVAENEDDRKMASLLSMKLKPSLNVAQNTKLTRAKMLAQSSLPTAAFTAVKEAKAVRMLNSSAKDLGIVKRGAESGGDESKKIKLNSLVDYTSSSESD